MKTNKIWQLFKFFIVLIVVAFSAISCVDKISEKVASPLGYDLSNPQKFVMPDVLQEISGIAFNRGDNTFVYAQQDEDGRVFKLPLGVKDHSDTKFASKGDFEDIAIINDWIIVMKSNGDLFSFPLEDTGNADTKNVVQSFGLVEKGEYEGMFADEASGLVYLLCKNCKRDKNTMNTSGTILKFNVDGTLTSNGSFQVDATKMDKLSGKKKGTFHPSALAKHPITKEWYIVSSVNKALVVLDSNWQVKNVFHLSSNQFNQPEGIAFDRQGNLYISNEGSETQGGNILKFVYDVPKPKK